MDVWQKIESELHTQRVSRAAQLLIATFGADGAWVEAGKRHLELTKIGKHADSHRWREITDAIARSIKSNHNL
jgi:hypothetical protein